MTGSNIFIIFWNETTFNEKQMIISLCMLYAFCSSGVIGLPLWFSEPKILCQNPENLQFNHCSEEEMCKSSLPWEIDWAISPSTLITELNLFCERKYIKRIILSIVFLGGFLGCLTNFLIVIKPEKKKLCHALLGIIFSISNFSILFFSHSEYIVGASLGILYFSCMIGNAYGFILINEHFSGDVAKMATIFMTLSWGIFGILFGFFAYMINSNWKILFFTMGSLVFLISLYLLFYNNEKGVKETLSKAPTNVIQFLQELKRIPQIKTNYICYVFIWTATSLTYNDILLELNTLGGNLYINMMMNSGVEILASFSASIISLKLSIAGSLKKITITLVFLFASFFFSPIDEEKDGLDTILLLTCMLIGKYCSEIVCNLTYLYAPKLLTDKFTPYFLVSVRLFSRICLLFLPHVNFFFRIANLHAFSFLALIWAFATFLQKFVNEVQPEGIEDILNEFKVNVLGRMSIMTGSSMIHHPPDELLKNIEVEGGNLSIVKNSRLGVTHQSLIELQKPLILHRMSYG